MAHPAPSRPRSGVPTPVVALCAIAALASCATPVLAASLTRSIEVDASPEQVWAVIGPFCAIRDWHPAVGRCSLDGGSPPTRTLVTRDGAATFVEPEVARDEQAHAYSYTFRSSPFPVTRYTGTIRVAPRAGGGSTIIWHGVYTAEPGRDQEAYQDFASIYEPGLAALKARFSY
jgi:hypothetical protein